MIKENLKNKKVAVLGFGITGQSAVKYLAHNGASKIEVYDARKEIDFDSRMIESFKKYKNLVFNFENDFIENITDFDLLVTSPGVPLTNSTIQNAIKNKVPVYNDLTLALPELHKIGPIVGVTGTNGKSTTVSLLFEILKSSAPTILVGNIGKSPLEELLKDNYDEKIVIIEISSYQAELFKPEDSVDVAVITNISPDHLDRHQNDINIYASEKMKILNPEKTNLIIPIDDPGIQKYVLPKIGQTPVTGVSLSEIFPELENFLDPQDRNLKGDHNLLNIALVLKVLAILNIKLTPEIIKIIKNYQGLEHRIEFVREIDGVKYINDSKSTTPESTRIALEAFGDQKNIVLLAGGTDKKVSFDILDDSINQYVKFIIILDNAINEKMQRLAEKNNAKWEIVKSMKEAVQLARRIAQEGEIVLLSPASASFGMFKNYEDRGQQFKKEVLNLSK